MIRGTIYCKKSIPKGGLQSQNILKLNLRLFYLLPSYNYKNLNILKKYTRMIFNIKIFFLLNIYIESNPHNEHLTVVFTSISPSFFLCYVMLANTKVLLVWKYRGGKLKRALHRRFLIGWKKIHYNKIY